MQTLFTFEVTDGRHHQLAGAGESEAIHRLQQRLIGLARTAADLTIVYPEMIRERAQYPCFEDFSKSFTLIKNPASNSEGEPASCMFETDGEDFQFIMSQPRNRVWTLIEEDGIQWLDPGLHYVNCLGYFITQEEWSDEDLLYFYAD